MSTAGVADVVGAMTAVAYNVLIIGLFLARLGAMPRLEYVLGAIGIASVVPLTWLLWNAPASGRPTIYYVWIGLMILFQIVELLLDYVYGIEFRSVRWMAIAYVMLFFGATGGMLGLASLAGRGWAIAATSTWLVMAVLAFVQRAITGQ